MGGVKYWLKLFVLPVVLLLLGLNLISLSQRPKFENFWNLFILLKSQDLIIYALIKDAEFFVLLFQMGAGTEYGKKLLAL